MSLVDVSLTLYNHWGVFYIMEEIKTIIIDDVKLIRTELKSLLNPYPNIKVVGEAAKVQDAIMLVKKENIDLVFLDIQLSGQSGFDFLEQVEANLKIIFVSSFDKYMPQAQKYNPVDFLMKPIDKKKLDLAIQKVLQNTSVV